MTNKNVIHYKIAHVRGMQINDNKYNQNNHLYSINKGKNSHKLNNNNNNTSRLHHLHCILFMRSPIEITKYIYSTTKE